MATPAAADYAVVQKRILDAANLTYRPLKEQQTLYIETADALRELGYSTQQALDIQDSFGQRSVIRFSQLKLLPALPAGHFKFEVPAGADVMQQ